MIEIDGSSGEGGGQIVRSALALSAVTGQPLRIHNIRRQRSKPGLLRQHLTGLRAIAAVCRASVEGDSLGSTTLQFEPRPTQGGEYTFDVGSAGSTVLVAQTVLPALLVASSPSVIKIGGGTHAPWAPPFDFFERCFLPQLRKMNADVEVAIEAHGFYPAGGGRIELRVEPLRQWHGLELLERHGALRLRVMALVSRLPLSIAQRECDTIARSATWPIEHSQAIEVPNSGGPGNVVLIESILDNVRDVTIGFGKIGVRAEEVAEQTLRETKTYFEADYPVGEYLADQLILPMGLAAAAGQSSRFATGPLSRHTRTQIDLLRAFLDVQIDTRDEDARTIVSFAPDR